MKKTRRMHFSKETLRKLHDYFIKELNVYTVYLFGSYGTECETRMSDIDIAILFHDKSIPLIEEMRTGAEVEFILGQRKVDVVNLNKTNMSLQHEIISTGIKLFERDPVFTADFVESVLKRYFDFGFTLKKLKQDYLQSLREEYLNGN